MRTHGTLTRWNDDRGFGFITPAKGPPEVFVHISAFPREAGRPRLNELISFEVEPGKDGKPRAMRVMRTAQRSVPQSAPVSIPTPAPSFTCDGRTMCSQMNSCAEATYFLHNCPNTKMDGDRDGRACEDQLCGH